MLYWFCIEIQESQTQSWSFAGETVYLLFIIFIQQNVICWSNSNVLNIKLMMESD